VVEGRQWEDDNEDEGERWGTRAGKREIDVRKKIEKQVGAESRKLSNQKAEVKRKAPNQKYGP